MILKLKWNKYRERWIMLDDKERFIEEFPDCRNFNWVFPKLNKSAINDYDLLTATKTGEEVLDGK